MDEAIQLLLTYVRMVWRFRWLALVVAVVTCLVGWTVVAMLPDQYQASAKVFVDTRSLLRPVLKGLAVDNRMSSDTTDMVRRTLFARPNLEAIARKTDLDLQAETPEDFDRLLTDISKRIGLGGTSRDNIFVIGFTDEDRQMAASVVEAVLNLFVERSLGESRKDTSSTRQFVERQIAEYEARLEAAEARVKEFMQRNQGLMPGQGQNYYGQLAAARGELAAAELALREAVSRRDTLLAQVEGNEPTFGIGPPDSASASARSPYDQRIAELESNLDQLLISYTERHPDVKYTRDLLAELKSQRDAHFEQLAAELAAAQEDGQVVGYDVSGNPIYQNMRIALGSAEAEVGALQERVTEYDGRVQKLLELVDTVPRVEAELKKLNRDYEVNQRNYQELVKRREQLKLADEATQSGDNVEFNIVEPPRVPLFPVGPEREVLSSAVLVGGLGVGVGLALLLGLLKPAIYTREGLDTITNLPVLGVVSRIWTPRERLRRRFEVASFGVGCVCLLALFGGLQTLYAMNVDITGRLQNVQTMVDKIVERVS